LCKAVLFTTISGPGGRAEALPYIAGVTPAAGTEPRRYMCDRGRMPALQGRVVAQSWGERVN
jgi:hypothetical protein